jgi:hypothetical protein
MNRRTLRTFAQATTCFAVGAAFTAGCVYAVQPDDLTGPALVPSSGQSVGTTFRALTTEEIDVLAEGDEPDRRWETCEMNTDYAIWCGDDGTWHEYPVPEYDPNTEDTGGVYDHGAKAAATDLDVCEGPDDEPTNIPCRVPMRETYVIGGDGSDHHGCVIVITTVEDSEMVCADDTVWAS